MSQAYDDAVRFISALHIVAPWLLSQSRENSPERMFKKFFDWFRKRPAPPPAPLPVPRVVARVAENAPPLAKVETASLSLAAILARLPDDLKSTVRQTPGAEVLVALPLTTIVKQLPTGSVKMSFASLHRQSPPGTFSARPVEAKRLIEVPLSEIFKRVSPAVLRRREDQRRLEIADGFDLFGDEENPYAIAPTEPEQAEEAPPLARHAAPLRMPEPVAAHSAPMAATVAVASAAPAPMRTIAAPAALAPKSQQRGKQRGKGNKGSNNAPNISAPSVAAASSIATSTSVPTAAPVATVEEAPQEEQPPLILSLADVCSGWPGDIRAEIGKLHQPTVALPASQVAAGLAKGKVSFTWSQVRAWTTPGIPSDSGIADAMELSIPLRIIAPAFLKLTKQNSPRKNVAIDETIPALFAGGREKPPVETPAETPPIAVAEPPPEAPPAPAPEEAGEEAAPESIAPEIAVSPTPFAEETTPKDNAAEAAETEAAPPTETASAEDAEVAPLPGTPALRPTPIPLHDDRIPQTVGELFGQPDKHDWNPFEIVENVVKLPQIAGAIVGLKEGLVVAHHLPEGMKGEVVAAFLPQIFARLNQYASEMKLGELDDLLFSTHGAHMQIFRLGDVFFGVLGKPGEALPWHELHLISQELARNADR